jgi:hypothetical protein
VTSESCHDPTNGGRPQCIQTDRLDAIESEAAQRTIVEARLERRVTEEFLGVFAAISRVETKVDRLLEGVTIGQVHKRPTLPSLDYDPDESTLTGREPEVAATVWKARNAESIEREAALQVQVAALEATISATNAERRRNSERVDREDRRAWTKWEKIGGIIVAIIAALGGGVGLAQLFGG